IPKRDAPEHSAPLGRTYPEAAYTRAGPACNRDCTIASVDNRRMCPNCRAFITTSDKVCPYCDVKVAPRAVEQRSPGDVLGGLIPHARFTTILILLINTAVSAACQFSPALLQAGESLPWMYERQQPWRLITAGFLHGGIVHILMNSWVLFDLGAEVEQFFGTSRMIVFYFISTITGFWASSYFGHVSVGSS